MLNIIRLFWISGQLSFPLSPSGRTTAFPHEEVCGKQFEHIIKRHSIVVAKINEGSFKLELFLEQQLILEKVSFSSKFLLQHAFKFYLQHCHVVIKLLWSSMVVVISVRFSGIFYMVPYFNSTQMKQFAGLVL